MILPITKSKIANLLVYLATHIQGLIITTTVKLFYMIDENAVKEIGSPATYAYQLYNFLARKENI